MSNIQNKPKLTSSQLVDYMKNEKGIRFNLVSETEATLYFTDSNNYLRTASYRKNYQKYTNGINNVIGKYIDLEFAYLKELSAIDFHLRRLILNMCVDIEHDIKVNILKEIELDTTNDGYAIVHSFLSSNNEILKKIARTSKSPFTEDLVSKYFTINKNPNSNKREYIIQKYDDYPLWVLFELLSFGDLIYFLEFYKKNYPTNISLSRNILNLVKSLRNAAAHNNCIISNLNHGTSVTPPEISQRIAKITTIKPDQRKKKLSTRPILEFTALLYAYDIIVSKKIKDKTINEIKYLFFVRMRRNKSFFSSNQLITSSYVFIIKVLQDFFQLNATLKIN